MALSTYSDLQTAVGEWIAKSNLSARAADFIRLAEAHLNRVVRIRQNMATTSLTLAQGTASVALPAGFLEEIELNYADQQYELNRAPFDKIDFENSADSASFRPSWYAITSDSIIFETEADRDYSLTLRYYRAWDIATDLSNWLLTNAPDAYLFGSLAEAADYQRDTAALQRYLARRDASVQSILNTDARNKRPILTVDAALL